MHLACKHSGIAIIVQCDGSIVCVMVYLLIVLFCFPFFPQYVEGYVKCPFANGIGVISINIMHRSAIIGIVNNGTLFFQYIVYPRLRLIEVPGLTWCVS